MKLYTLTRLGPRPPRLHPPPWPSKLKRYRIEPTCFFVTARLLVQGKPIKAGIVAMVRAAVPEASPSGASEADSE